MHLAPLILSLAIAAQVALPAYAQQLPPGMTIGTDGPADVATAGIWTNHIGLNVRNLTASMEFYGHILGMRHIFTIQYTESYSLTYMGFSQGGKNGTGYQTGTELLRHKNNSGGLIKLLYNTKSQITPAPSTVHTNTFANIGIVVPDVQAVQDRLEKHEVAIAKRMGEASLPADGAVASAFNIGPMSTSNLTEVEELIDGLLTTDLASILFAEDPDGNMLEIVAQNGF